jgi:cytochrome c oxidase assembly factor 1
MGQSANIDTERLASSVMRSVTFQLRHHTEVAKLLGDNVKLETPWWGGDPWVAGSVNTMQGRVDLKFRITGTTGRIGLLDRDTPELTFNG